MVAIDREIVISSLMHGLRSQKIKAFQIKTLLLSGLIIGGTCTAALIPLSAIANVANNSPDQLAQTRPRQNRSQHLSLQLQTWVQRNPLILLPAAYLLLYLSIFVLRPLWLLKLDDVLKPVSLKLPWDLELSPRLLLFFRYHPRVLDAWVTHHLPAARAAFLTRPTVQDRAIHLPVPVDLDRSSIADLKGADLQPYFHQARCLLLIHGEGGSGKTSLACQIARWATSDNPEQRLCPHHLLPVLIETDLSAAKPLPDAIRQQLPPSNNGLPISDDLLNALLRQQRLLLIIDHFSEMGEASRQQIQTDLLRWPANALIITSRLEDELPNRSKIRLQPQRIEGGRLFDFFSAYLRQQNCRDAFDDEDLFQACRRLTGMNPERQITVLLAKLYIEQLIDAQLGRAGSLPDNIPDLMCSYLNRLNASIDANHQQPNLAVQQWARAVAWVCLETTYRPATARREDALVLLKTENPTELAPSDCLTYLEQRLRLIQTLEPGDQLRLTLDPLAEYLAGLYLVAYCSKTINGDSETLWRKFLTSVEAKQADPETIRGFLLAVRDCCQSQRIKTPIPDFVADALAQLAGLDPAELERARRQQRIRRLTNNLVLPDAADRAYAAAELGKLGLEVRNAIPALERQLHNQDEDLMVRRQVLETLVAVGWDVEQCFAILENDQEVLSLRCLAAGLLKQQPASALSRTIPDPIVEWRDGQQSLQLATIPVEVEDLGQGTTLEMVSIPGGSFLMGSPETEPGRFDNESPQHTVTVPSFLMGRYPITQAQWLVVAGWEAIERPLDLDPATFKGSRLPVECISWYEAVEFCNRLAHQTGRGYRLPSEAEWEYACRAGTITSYHVGNILNTDLANFGRLRGKTTSVGLFGAANAWGLYDMHGNVWEWCADLWHGNYESAPRDGSVWVTAGDPYERVLRGGYWNLHPRSCRSSLRRHNDPMLHYDSIGFRVACVAP